MRSSTTPMRSEFHYRSRGLACILCALVGCSVYDASFLEVDAGVDVGVDANTGRDSAEPDVADARDSSRGMMDMGEDVPEPSDAGHDSMVELLQPAPRPTVDDEPDGDVLVFALRDPVLAQRDTWEQYSYDLDGLLTSRDSPLGECAPRGGSILDGAGGVDNVTGESVFPFLIETSPGEPVEFARSEMQAGRGAFVLELRGYSGAANDPSVQLVFAEGVGVVEGEPVWAGEDRWQVSDADFSDRDPDRPTMRDASAYVADGLLVARFVDGLDFRIPWSERGLFIRLSNALITARFDSGGLDDVRIVGRWRTADAAATLPDLGVCADSSRFTFARDVLDSNADLLLEAGAMCDALSFGLGMTGYAALLEGLAPLPDRPADPCP